MDFQYVLMLLRYLYNLLNSSKLVENESDLHLSRFQVVDWINLLLDAHFTHLVLSDAHTTLVKMHETVSAQLRDISTPQQLKVEMETRGQNGNCKWRETRALRITASRFGEICRATERKDLTKLAESLVNPVHFSSKATAHGNKYEAIAVEAFEHIKGRTSECGLFIGPDHPWLGASPDRIFDDNSIVEVKCPFQAKDMLIDSVTVPYRQQGEKGLELKPTHIYHYQVQGQLMCSQRTLCYFCVYTLKDFKVIEIKRDDIFISFSMTSYI